MVKHELLIPCPVLEEKQGDFVAHFSATVAVTPKRTIILSYRKPDLGRFKTELTVKNEELAKLLAEELELKKKK